IPNSVTSIGLWAFVNCTSLSSINIPDSVAVIGVGAFKGCTDLTSINIPVNVTQIGEETFYNCISLEKVFIPDNIEFISLGRETPQVNFKGAFDGCDNLTYISFRGGVYSNIEEIINLIYD
ncbi:MAG: leucine-rich repeat domain-containing protein, partial [Oscillospiraceae bacterium]|nr:leucine-rich repeat domain-containing protein [Oscillospiraceae bacterium]